MAKEYNLGRFSIEKTFIDEMFGTVINAFSSLKIVPIKGDYNSVDKTYDYVARSPNFDLVKEGDKVPKYDILATRATEDVLLPATFKLKFKLKKIEENNE